MSFKKEVYSLPPCFYEAAETASKKVEKHLIRATANRQKRKVYFKNVQFVDDSISSCLLSNRVCGIVFIL